MKADSKYKVFVPKNPRLNFAFEEVQTVYFRGYTDFLDGDDYIDISPTISSRTKLIHQGFGHLDYT